MTKLKLDTSKPVFHISNDLKGFKDRLVQIFTISGKIIDGRLEKIMMPSNEELYLYIRDYENNLLKVNAKETHTIEQKEP